MGGKNPLFVLADADLRMRSTRGSFDRAALHRVVTIIVEEPIYLISRTPSGRCGLVDDETGTHRPVVDASQFEAVYPALARAKASAAAGSSRYPGFYMACPCQTPTTCASREDLRPGPAHVTITLAIANVEFGRRHLHQA